LSVDTAEGASPGDSARPWISVHVALDLLMPSERRAQEAR